MKTNNESKGRVIVRNEEVMSNNKINDNNVSNNDGDNNSKLIY